MATTTPAGTPQPYDIVGVGSNATEYVLDQISAGYDSSIPASRHNAKNPWLFSYDATPPGATAPGNYPIVPKAGCAAIVRPNGSSAGLQALDTSELDGSTGYSCIDFGRSAYGRSSSAPRLAPGGVAYVAFAKDAVTWATRSAALGGSNAPASLTQAQLQGIFTCSITNWAQVGGKAGDIGVYLPQPGSATLAFWEQVMGITTPGACVSQAPAEDEGTYTGFNSPNAIFIFSIGSYIAQKYHSAACGVTPTRTQNAFGCNATGFLSINEIDGIPPTTSAAVPVTNPAFPSSFYRTLYNIVRYSATTADHIPAYLEPFFAARTAAVPGYFCTSSVAMADIAAYGFINTPLCGSVS